MLELNLGGKKKSKISTILFNSTMERNQNKNFLNTFPFPSLLFFQNIHHRHFVAVVLGLLEIKPLQDVWLMGLK
jgi:hypothetical protein